MFIQVQTDPTSLYERVGGQPFFDTLIERFYAGVEHDAVLRPLYPSDLEPSKRHLSLFLAQYWGGPTAYNAERGHPRLRMRHVRLSIGQAERDAWVLHMRSAVQASDASIADVEALMSYFTTAATSLINQSGEAMSVELR